MTIDFTVNEVGKSRPKVSEGIASTKKAVGDLLELFQPLSDVAVLTVGECRFECQIKAADIEWFKFNERLALTSVH